MGLEFRVLGALEVLHRGEPVALGGAQQRSILAVLIVNAGRAVSTERLIAEIWDESEPAAARKSVQAYVAHLRRLVNIDTEILRSQPPGYLLSPESVDIDSVRFEALAEDALSLLAEDPASATDLLRRALALWRGRPFGALADEVASLRLEADRLEEVRLRVLEGRIEGDIRTNRGSGLIPELSGLVAEHPYREGLRALQMLALYRSGRQAEALAVYQQTRHALAQELGIEPSPALQRLEQSLLDHDPRLETDIAFSALTIGQSQDRERNPYKGLRSFTEEDAEDFYGRAGLVRQMVERLSIRDKSARFLIVAGPSGSGKSSAVRAGLIPAIHRGAVDGSNDWRVVTMYPGEDPWGSLPLALRAPGGAAPSSAPTVVVIDQFEEVFTLSVPDRARDFLDGLASMVGSTKPFRVIITIRADFLDRLLQHPTLAPLVQAALVLVPPLEGHEIRSAIEGPAGKSGVRVDPELVEAATQDTVSRVGGLPLLQFAFTDIFERRTENRLTMAGYRAAGGIAGALAKTADGAYEQLDEARRDVARQLLLRLVALTEAGEPTRRRVKRGDLALVGVDEPHIEAVLELLIRHRLVTTGRETLSGAPTVEVAHEALFEEWDRFRRWIEVSREDLRQRERLSRAIAGWQEGGRDSSDLLRGERLQQTEAWADATSVALSAAELEYLADSRAVEDAQMQQRRRRRGSVLVALSVATAVSLGLAAFALEQRGEAQGQAHLARTSELAARAIQALDRDPQLGILLAFQAIEDYKAAGSPIGRDALEALHHAVLASRVRAVFEHGHYNPVGVAFSPDSSHLATGDGTGMVQIRHPHTGEVVKSLEGHQGGVVDVKWSTDSRLILSTSPDDGTVRLWEVDTGEEVWRADVDGAPLVGAISPDGTRLAATVGDDSGGHLAVWDLAADTKWTRRDFGLPIAVAFDPLDGGRVAVTNWVPQQIGGGVYLLDADSGDERQWIPTSLGECEVRWGSDGSRLITAGGAGATVWDAATGEELVGFTGHHGSVCSIDVSADGDVVVTGGEDGFARVWRVDSGETLLVLGGHTERVGWVALSPDGRTVATISNDGTGRIWDISSSGRTEVLTVDLERAHDGQYATDGSLIMAVGSKGEVLVTDAANGDTVRRFDHDEPVLAADLSPDDGLVATGTQGGTATVWEIAARAMRARIEVVPLIPGRSFPAMPIVAAAWSPAGDVVALGTPVSVHLWNVNTGTLTQLEAPFPSFLFSLAFSADGSLLAGGFGGPLTDQMWIWEADSGEKQGELSIGATFSEANSLQFSGDTALLLAAHTDGVIRAWDLEVGAPVVEYVGHAGRVVDATFSPDGTVVASAGVDGTVRLWGGPSGEQLLVLDGQPGPSSVAFSPAGDHLLITGSTGLHVYLTDPDDLIDLALSRLVRWWTPSECLHLLGATQCPAPPQHLAPMEGHLGERFRERGLHSLHDSAAPSRGLAVVHRDDGLSSPVSFSLVAERLGNPTQGVGSVDDRNNHTGLDELCENFEVSPARHRQKGDHSLTHEG